MKSQLDIGNKDHLFLSTFIKMQQKSHLSDILLWLNKNQWHNIERYGYLMFT